MGEAFQLSPTLSDWIMAVAGGRAERAELLSGGGSRTTVLVDARDSGGGLLPLVLRMEDGASAHSGTSFSLAREYAAYRALATSGVPVPRAYGLTPDGQALLLERVPGTGDFRKIAASDQAAVAGHFMACLGRLHALDVSRLDLPGFARPRTAREHVTLDLGRWEALARAHCWDDPLIRFSFGRLAAAAPEAVQRTVLVQGDTGPGNFLAEGPRVTGLIDWEFCHLGDPMSDLGWLRVRCRTPEELALFEIAYPAYEQASGLTVDEAGVAFHETFALLRCAITVAMAAARGGALGTIPYRVALQDFRMRLGNSLLAGMGGQAARKVSLMSPPTGLHGEAIDELTRHLLPGAQTRRQKVAAHAVLSVLQHLQRRDAFGPGLQAETDAENRTLLGDIPAPEAFADLAEQRGAAGDGVFLASLVRQIHREAALWPSAR